MNKENIIDLKRKITNKWIETKEPVLDEVLNVLDYLQNKLEEKDNVIDEKNKCLLEIAKETIEIVNWLKSKGMNFDNESWVSELEEILERGKIC